MQEEVENRTVNLAVTTTRMTARAILSGIRTYLYPMRATITGRMQEAEKKKKEIFISTPFNSIIVKNAYS